MVTNAILATTSLERLCYFFPGRNNEIQSVVRDALLVREQLEQIIEAADANHNITEDQEDGFREIMKVCCEIEDKFELLELELASKLITDVISKIKKARQQPKEISELLVRLGGMIDQLASHKHSDAPPKQQAALEPVEMDVIENEKERIEGILEEDMRDLVPALAGGTPSLGIITIYGMAGIGKTTLAQKLFRDLGFRFDVRAWICISREFEEVRILREILANVCLTWVNNREAATLTLEELAEIIYRSLKGRRYLIVLDDVWSTDVWHSLRLVFPDDNIGSRVLITTRLPELAIRISPNAFRHHLTISEPTSQVIEERPKVYQGLPLAGDKTAFLSEALLKEKKQLLDIIENSYKALPLHLRLCLLYLGNFPEDRATECDTVCQLWMAEGLISIEKLRDGEQMMDAAARYLDELANRNWLIAEDQVSGQERFKSCRIHDLVREFCKTKGKQDKFFEVTDLVKGKQNVNSSIRSSIYLDKFEYTHSHLYGNADYLRSLLFFTSNQSEEGKIRPREIPNLDNFIWLRVLYLYGIDFLQGKLPKGVEKLRFLRYLSFRQCYLEDLSSLVGNMLYLQTLDLRVRRECEMTITEALASFKRLKYLYLPLNYRTLAHEKLQLGQLNELEILDNFDTSQCHDWALLELTNLQKLTITTEGDISVIASILITLENYQNQLSSLSLNIRNFDCHSKRRFSVMEKVFNSSGIHALEVEGHLGRLPVLDTISSKFTKIILNGSELVQDPMQILQKLPHLNILALEYEAYVGEKMRCSDFGFPELRYLRLSKLYNLIYWDVEGEMPSLSTVVIENCKNLDMLPDGLVSCKRLQNLEIASMSDAFVGRIQMSNGTAGADFYKIKHVQHVIIDHQPLILKRNQQDGPGEDPQCSSTL